MNSWLLSMRWCERVATERAIDTASTRPSMAIASAPGARVRTAAVERSGHDSGGRRPADEPTSRTPCSPPCSAAAVRLPAIIAMSSPGSFGRKTLRSTAVTSVTPETASTVGLASERCRKTFSQMWMKACCFVPGMPRKVLT